MAELDAHVPVWKHVGRVAAWSLGAPAGLAWMWLLRLSSRKAGVALMYHAVEPRSGDAARELVPPHNAALFDRQIRHVRRHYRIVAAADLQAAAASRRRGQRFPVAITFDDDLACHVAVALPILQRHGATATFFLSGASLERPFAFWYERLQRAFAERLPRIGALVLGDRRLEEAEPGIHALSRVIVNEFRPEERHAMSERLAAVLGPDPPDAGIRAADVRELAASGMTIGFHTLRHDGLSLLDDTALERALTDGVPELAGAAGRPVEVIGYPHGLADERVGRAARVAGFTTGFTTRHDPVTPESDELLQGRVGPSLRSVGILAMQLPLTLRRA